MLSVDHLKSVRHVALYLVGVSVLSACTTVTERIPVQDGVKPEGASASTQRQVAAEYLTRTNDLQVELRELRNQLEEQQFELENLKQRQQDLFQGLDQRLRVAENVRQNEPLALVDLSQASADAAQAETNASSEVPKEDQHQMTPDGMSNTAGEAEVGDDPDPDPQVPEVASVGQQSLYDQGFEHLKDSRYTEAINLFTQLVNQHPNGGLADDASYWIGEANYVNRQYEAAIRAFRSVVTQYPSSDRVPEALLKVGYVQYDIGDYKNAKATFNDVLQRYADHPVSISAKSRLERIERGISN